MRLINVDGEYWWWYVGRSNVVAIGPNRQKLVAHCGQVNKVGTSNFERGQRKRTRDGAVLPSDVANWIREHNT